MTYLTSYILVNLLTAGMDKKAKYLVIEGCDGSGKSTQTKILANYLKKKKYKVLAISEPSKNVLGKLISTKLVKRKNGYSKESIALAFASDRLILKDEILNGAFDKYDFIISDRSYISSLVYQPLLGVDVGWIKELNRFAAKPDLLIILDISTTEFMKRKGETDVIFEKKDFQEKVRQNYLEIPDVVDEKALIVDATQTKEKVTKDILLILGREFGIK